MRLFLCILAVLAALSVPTVAEARCRPVARVAAAPVRVVVAVKPVRRAVAVPVRVLKLCCRR